MPTFLFVLIDIFRIRLVNSNNKCTNGAKKVSNAFNFKIIVIIRFPSTMKKYLMMHLLRNGLVYFTKANACFRPRGNVFQPDFCSNSMFSFII